jgi:cyclopropane fatty-acyl-phospholipid synthase-like methyltransferase
MSFEDPRGTWNARFAGAEYHFGRAPNAFLAREASRLHPGQSVLCVADGEGRNGVFLAKRGLDVTAFDIAGNGVAKARALAAEHAASIDVREVDIRAWDWDARTYDAVVAIFIQFLTPEERPEVFRGMQRAVRAGGLMLLEGYRPEQIGYGTGGPGKPGHLYTRAWLEETFRGWEMLRLDAYDAEIHEGGGHAGMSALIDLVARKPG